MERSDKKRILTKILIVIAALTLLSCCFLGSTFARYVTSDLGKAAVGVAKWNVAVTAEERVNVEVASNKLSPSMDVYNSGTHSSTPRSNTMDKFLVATIVNSGEVDAKVSVSGNGTPTLTIEDSHKSDTEAGTAPNCFSISFTYGTENNSTNATTALPSQLDVDAGSTVYIFAQVTWTSQDTSRNGDTLDTWIGENVTAVTWTLDFEAVQDEEFPQP